MNTLAEGLIYIGIFFIAILMIISAMEGIDNRKMEIIELKHQIDSLENCLEYTRDSLNQYIDYRIDTGKTVFRKF